MQTTQLDATRIERSRRGNRKERRETHLPDTSICIVVSSLVGNNDETNGADSNFSRLSRVENQPLRELKFV